MYDVQHELHVPSNMERELNACQRFAYFRVLEDVPKVFLLDVPGGSGKTCV